MSSMLKLLLPLTREKRGGLQRSLLRISQSSRQAIAQRPGSVVKHDVLPDQRFGPPASGPIQLGEIGPRQGMPGR